MMATEIRKYTEKKIWKIVNDNHRLTNPVCEFHLRDQNEIMKSNALFASKLAPAREIWIFRGDLDELLVRTARPTILFFNISV